MIFKLKRMDAITQGASVASEDREEEEPYKFSSIRSLGKNEEPTHITEKQ